MDGFFAWLGLVLLSAVVRDGCIRIADAIRSTKDTP